MRFFIIFLFFISLNLHAGTWVFLSDLEGNGAKWDTFIKQSGCFEGRSPRLQKIKSGYENVAFLKSSRGLRLKDNCSFFYLGDAVDKGNASIRILRDLVYLKEAYGDRVGLIPGNREINKLRWLQEISPEGDLVPKNFYKFSRAKFSVDQAESLLKNKKFSNALNTYFGSTFGAPKAMDHRCEELGLCPKNSSVNRNDEKLRKKILQSLREDVEVYSPDEKGGPSKGLLSRYLMLSEVVLRVQDNLLSHGHIGLDSLGEVPGQQRMYIRSSSDLGSWIRKLNDFKNNNFKTIMNKGFYQGNDEKIIYQGGDLILYQEPLLDGKFSFNQASVVLGRNSDPKDFGNVFDQSQGSHGKIEKILRSVGISTRIAGHTPVGQSSLIQRIPASGSTERPSWVINIDNSADHARMNGVTNIFKLINNDTFSTSSMVNLNNRKTLVRSEFKKDGSDDAHIGLRYECGNKNYTVIGKLPSSKKYLLYRVEAKYQTNNMESDLKDCKKL